MYTIFGFGNVFYVFEVGAIAIPGWLIAALGFLIFEAVLSEVPTFGLFFLAILFMVTAMMEQVSFRDQATYVPKYVSTVKMNCSIIMNGVGFLVVAAGFLTKGVIGHYSTLTDSGWLNELLGMVLLGQLGRFLMYILAACADFLTKVGGPKFSTFVSTVVYAGGCAAYLVVTNRLVDYELYYEHLKFGLSLVYGGVA